MNVHAEGARIMQICNACRYCEGYCAVFPAMERRLTFDPPTLDYLANLCHHCGACYYACQYAPPHEFAVNVPRTFAQVRRQSYEEFAWPRAFGSAYRHQGVLFAFALAGSIAAFLVSLLVFVGRGGVFERHIGPNAFYAVFPHEWLVLIFGVAFVFAIVAMAIGAVRFTRSIRAASRNSESFEYVPELWTLRNLDGGGEGCYVRAGFDHSPDRSRKWFHHFTFYGFLLCFASTALATVHHYLGSPAPYPLTSLVVVLGTLGGIGLVVGPLGLLLLKRQHDPVLLDPEQGTLDTAFTTLLLLTSVTGLALLALRDTAAMPVTFAIHLGVVLALFLSLPYGKFVHGLYRGLSLAQNQRERYDGGIQTGV